jgi:hypothetical protein
MRRMLVVGLLTSAAALTAPAAAQRYARPMGDPSILDTTAVFEGGDRIHVSSVFRMATGIEVCAAIGPGIHWGKMLFARSEAETNSAEAAVVSFPSSSGSPLCTVHRPSGGDWLVVSFTRTVTDHYGRVGRLSVGQIVLPLAPLERRRVVFTWQREGDFEISSVTPAPDTVHAPRP